MSGTIEGSKKYYYGTEELAKNAMSKAIKAHVSVFPVPDDKSALLVGLPSEPQTQEARAALRENCIRIDEYKKIKCDYSGSSAIFDGDKLSETLPDKFEWVTIEEDQGSGLLKVGTSRSD